MDRIYRGLAARKTEMDNDRGRGRRAGDTGLRQYQLLFFEVLRRPGEFEERALQGRAEVVRSADGSKPVHGFAWPSLPGCSRGAVAIPIRRRHNKVSCIRTEIHDHSRPTGTAVTGASGREGIGISVLPRERAIPEANP